MAYPRQCEGCDFAYSSLPVQGTGAHLTLAAQDGGTRSPWGADLPGRILDIGCKVCGAVFQWDYFGRAPDGRLGTSLGLLRGPREDWREDQAFATDSLYSAPRALARRAS